MRITPDREVAAGRLRVARAFKIAVGQKHRRFRSIRLDPHAIGREHVGAIEEIGYAAKAFRLALRAIGRARAIKPHELGVGRRIQARLDRERECPSGRSAQQKARRLCFELRRVERLAIQSGGDEREFIAIERERHASPASRIGAHREGRDNARRMDIERHVKLDMVDEIVRRPILAEANGLSVRRTHGKPLKALELVRLAPVKGARYACRYGPRWARAAKGRLAPFFSRNGRSRPPDARRVFGPSTVRALRRRCPFGQYGSRLAPFEGLNAAAQIAIR